MFNKIAVVVGAYGGLGKEISKVLIERSTPLVLIGKNPLVREYNDLNNNVRAYSIDVNNENALNKVLATGVEEIGMEIGYLIYAAGIMSYGSIMDESMETYMRVYRENVLLPVSTSKIVIKYMRENNFGNIIFISSIFSKVSIPKMSAYSMSKAALNSFMTILAMENNKYNIKINCIAPGLLKGKFAQNYLEEMLKDKDFIARYCYLSTPFVKHLDVINMIICLMESSTINGEIICVDNGYCFLSSTFPRKKRQNSLFSSREIPYFGRALIMHLCA